LDLEALKIVSESNYLSDKLLSSYPMGVRVKFKKSLKAWLDSDSGVNEDQSERSQAVVAASSSSLLNSVSLLVVIM
jgi:hypothetical protein